MSMAMTIGLFLLIIGVLLSPISVFLFFIFVIGYAIYLCVTPNKVWMTRIIEREKKKMERIRKKLLDNEVLTFINGGAYSVFDNEPSFLVMREYRNKLCKELLNNNNINDVKKIFKYDITAEREFIEYLKDLYLRRYTISTNFSWLYEEERKVVSKLDLLNKYNYYYDLEERWENYFEKKKIINTSSYSWIGLPRNSIFWRTYLKDREEV